MSAAIAPGGKKSSRLGYYLHIQPHGDSMIAGGLHMPEPIQLTKFREAIDRDARPSRQSSATRIASGILARWAVKK